MRNVHFKGIHHNKWVFGDLIHKRDGCFIGCVDDSIYQVAEETISEFTGITDLTEWLELSQQERDNLVEAYNNSHQTHFNISSFETVWHGRPVYENDILFCRHLFNENDQFESQVVNRKGCFGVIRKTYNMETFIPLSDLDEYKYCVVGNVFVIKEPQGNP